MEGLLGDIGVDLVFGFVSERILMKFGAERIGCVLHVGIYATALEQTA
jgi:hypothetical protein